MAKAPAGRTVADEALAAIDVMIDADEATMRRVGRAARAKARLAKLRRAADAIVEGSGLSYREAAILQAQYKLMDATLDVTQRQRGGRTAAQRLSDGLRVRRIQCTRDAFTAPALGHGSILLVQGVNREWDEFITEVNRLANAGEIRAVRDYLALKLAQQRVVGQPLERLPPDLLTFGDFQDLAMQLARIRSHGAAQQYGVAALVRAVQEQEQTGYEVRTKDVFAADEFAGSVTDVDVVDPGRNELVVDAYEVTLRRWASRLAEVEQKAVAAGLGRIHLIGEVREEPGRIAELLRPYRAVDIIVLDLASLLATLAAQLTPVHRLDAIKYWEGLLAASDRLWEPLQRFREIVAAFKARHEHER